MPGTTVKIPGIGDPLRAEYGTYVDGVLTVMSAGDAGTKVPEELKDALWLRLTEDRSRDGVGGFFSKDAAVEIIEAIAAACGIDLDEWGGERDELDVALRDL